MPRSLDPVLEAALDSGQFTPYFLLTVKDADSGATIKTIAPVYFKLAGIEMEVKFVNQVESVYAGYTTPYELKFMLTRGVTVNGVNYTIDSSYYFGIDNSWDGTFETIKACMLPAKKFSTTGDADYETVITAVCAEYGKTAVFGNPAAAWLAYQYLPTGRTLTLNKANTFITQLRQKYIIYACDNGSDEILFQAVANDARTSDHEISLATFVANVELNHPRQFLSRDEANTTHFSGSVDDPIWNLGFLHSTASHPTIKLSTSVEIKPIAPHLKYLTFDHFEFTFSENYPETSYINLPFIGAVEETFDYQAKQIPWNIKIKSFDWAKGTESGSPLPGTIEQSAPYTPLNTTSFNNNLDSTVNNLQALAEAVDDLTLGADTEEIQDIVGAMVSSNTETGITVTYQDANGTIDFVADVLESDIREKLTANRTYYVRTDGSDSNDGLTDSAGGAFLTIAKLSTVLSSLDGAGYSVTVNFGAGTWTETVSIKNLLNISSLIINGVFTTTESITASTGVKGTGATLGSFTRNSGTWTVNQRRYKLAKATNGTNNGMIIPIESNSTTVCTVQGAWATAPVNNDTFDILDWATSIVGTVTIETDIVVINNNIYFDPTLAVIVQKFANVVFNYCNIDTGTLSALYIQLFASVQIIACVVQSDITGVAITLPSHVSINIWNCIIVKIGATGGTGISVTTFGDLILGKGSVIDNFTTGVRATSHAQINWGAAAADIYNVVRNCTTGLTAFTGAQQRSTANNQYSANGTNENADATSYGYID